MSSKNVNVQKGKQGFQKTTPKAVTPAGSGSRGLFGKFKSNKTTASTLEDASESPNYDMETLDMLKEHIGARPAPPMPDPHPAEESIVAIGVSESKDSREWKAQQVFRGLVREGSLLCAPAPSQTEVNDFVNNLNTRSYASVRNLHAMRDIVEKHGSTMDGATWYATTHYLKQIAKNKETQNDPTGVLIEQRSKELHPIAALGRKSPHGSLAHSEWKAFLDKNGYDYD